MQRIIASIVFSLIAATAFNAHANMRELGTDELREVVAGDGTAADNVQANGAPQTGVPLLDSFLSFFKPQDLVTSQMTAAEFKAAWSAAAGNELPPELHDKQPVSQLAIQQTDIAASFNLSDVLKMVTGVNYEQKQGGPSMGTLSFEHLNAGGTRIWVWSH